MKINTHLDVDMVAIEANDEVTVMLSSRHRPRRTLRRRGPTKPSSSYSTVPAPWPAVGWRQPSAPSSIWSGGSMTATGSDSSCSTTRRMWPSRRDESVNSAATRSAGPSQPSGRVAARTFSGYLRGLQEARRAGSQAGSTLLLLSDGHANAGVTDPAQLRGVAAQAASAA